MSRTGTGYRARQSCTSSTRVCAGLQTDYVDLYQTHRWDYETPIEETLEALHDVVKAGKVRYIGASSMYAWQFAKALYLARSAWLDAVRHHAEPLQPALSRRRAGDDGAVRGRGDWRDSVESAGSRTADARVAVGDNEALGDGPLRQHDVFAHRGRRSQGRRPAGRDRGEARRAAGAGCTGVDAEQARGDRADRWRDQAASSEGCGCGALV